MPHGLLEFFAMIGIFVLFLAFIGLLIIFKDWLSEKIYILKQKYKDKHRFDDPPVAKCRCIGCSNWNRYNAEGKSGVCMVWSGYYTQDSEFCDRGVPRTNAMYEYDKKRGAI